MDEDVGCGMWLAVAHAVVQDEDVYYRVDERGYFGFGPARAFRTSNISIAARICLNTVTIFWDENFAANRVVVLVEDSE